MHVGTDGSAGGIVNFPWAGTQVMDMAFGPDGALYVLDYGSGFGNGDANSALYRIEYIGGGNRAPVAKADADKTSGQAPLTVNFSAAGSSDPDGDALSYSWAFGDGTSSTAANPTKTYTSNGTYNATLTVRDPDGATGTAGVRIGVGNTAPSVTINTPGNGQLFAYGDAVPFSFISGDPEDGTINCARAKMTYVLGHDSHGHQITSAGGCSGTITVPVDGEHDAAANIFAVFDAEYTDASGLTAHQQHILQPKHRQAEHFKTSFGINTFSKIPAEGGKTVGDIHNGDWIAFDPYRLSNVTSFTARVSSAGAGGTLQIRAGSPTGTVLGSAGVPVTGGWETFTTVIGTVTGAPSGTTTLYLTFSGGQGFLYDVDAFTLDTGTTSPASGPIKGLAGKCLDVNGAGSADGTKVQLWACHGGANQSWSRQGQTFRSLGKCLDVAGAGTANGTKVQLLTCGGGAGQNWTPQSDGTIRNPNSGKCLDVAGAGSADGTQIHIWDCHGGPNQKWVLPL